MKNSKEKSSVKGWQNMFDITMEDSEVIGLAGGTFRKRSYYLIYKATGEKFFPASRPYGYSQLSDAKRGAGKIFNSHMKSLEENLLGQS